MNSCCCKAFDLNRSEGAAKYFSGIYFFLIFKLSLQRKTRLKFNEIWHKIYWVKGGFFNSKEKTGIFLDIQKWQLWISNMHAFFIWRADIGIYCYSIETLDRFVKLEQSQNEIENRLEQLRALDNNIEINVSLAKSSPIGVDTEEDYLALKKIMEYKS